MPPPAPVLVVDCMTPDGPDDDRSIDAIGGTDAAGRRWHLPILDAVALAERGVQFVILHGEGRRAERESVPLNRVPMQRGTRYLRANSRIGAQLARVPLCRHRERTQPVLDEQTPLDRGCREALKYLRENCPDLVPGRLEPGETSAPLPVDVRRTTRLVAVAAQQAAARTGDDPTFPDEELPRAVVWTDGADSLLVLLETIKVDTRDGVVTVELDVACDEVSRGRPTRMSIDLVIGTDARPTGVLAAAPPPRGDPTIVRRWGDSLVALAWQALLDTAAGIASVAGTDPDGAGLIPTSWTATRAGLEITPQARHSMDRVLSTSASP